MATSSISLSLPPLTPSSSSSPKPLYSLKFFNPSIKFSSSLSISPTQRSNFSPYPFQQNSQKKGYQIWRISATAEDVLPQDTPIEIVSSNDGDGVSTIISALLFIAFVGLSVLTIGVVYIAVTDFLQKRERDKFDKEEDAKRSKKKGKKRVVRSKIGPKGFGQRFQEDDDD